MRGQDSGSEHENDVAWTHREAEAPGSAAAATPPPSFGQSPVAADPPAWAPQDAPAYSWSSPPADLPDLDVPDESEETNEFRAITPFDTRPPGLTRAAPASPYATAAPGPSIPADAPRSGDDHGRHGSAEQPGGSPEGFPPPGQAAGHPVQTPEGERPSPAFQDAEHGNWPPPWTPPPNLEDRARPWGPMPGTDAPWQTAFSGADQPGQHARPDFDASSAYGSADTPSPSGAPDPAPHTPAHAAPSHADPAGEPAARESYTPAHAVYGAPVYGAPVFEAPVDETASPGASAPYGDPPAYGGPASYGEQPTHAEPPAYADRPAYGEPAYGEPAYGDAPAQPNASAQAEASAKAEEPVSGRPAEPGDVPVWPPLRSGGEETPAPDDRHIQHDVPSVDHEVAAVEVTGAGAGWPTRPGAPAFEDSQGSAGLVPPPPIADPTPAGPTAADPQPFAGYNDRLPDGIGAGPVITGTVVPNSAVPAEFPAGPAAMGDETPSGAGGVLDRWPAADGRSHDAGAVPWSRPEGTPGGPVQADDDAIAAAITPTSGFAQTGGHPPLRIEEPSGAEPPMPSSSPHPTPGQMPKAPTPQDPAQAPTTPFAFTPVTPPRAAAKTPASGFDSLGSPGPVTSPQAVITLPPAPPGDPAKSPSGMVKKTFLGAVAVIAIGAIGTAAFYAYAGQPPTAVPTAAPSASRAATEATPTASPSATRAAATILDSEKTDPRKLTLKEAFPVSKITLGGRTYRAVKVNITGDCSQAAAGAFATALKKGKCSRVLRATYVDSKKQYAVTTGIAVLPTKAAALTADQSKSLGSNQWFRGLNGTPDTASDRVTISGGYAAGMVWGRYIVFSYATYADGHTPDAKDRSLGPISSAFRDHTAEVIEKRVTG
ncbi:hypothetical protein ACFFHJ_01275 [Planotetraspora thailandica]|nr:hypothetical protein [Planotetraspora thailandica]